MGLLAQRIEEIDVLGDAVTAALTEARNDEGVAAGLLADRMRDDKSLLFAFRDRLYMACRALVAEHVSSLRRDALGLTNRPGVSGEAKGYERSARVAATGFLYFVLPITGRPLLKDATVQQIEQAAGQYLTWAGDYRRKGEWLRDVAAAKKQGRRVNEQLVRELYEAHARA